MITKGRRLPSLPHTKAEYVLSGVSPGGFAGIMRTLLNVVCVNRIGLATSLSIAAASRVLIDIVFVPYRLGHFEVSKNFGETVSRNQMAWRFSLQTKGILRGRSGTHRHGAARGRTGHRSASAMKSRRFAQSWCHRRGREEYDKAAKSL